MVELSDFFVQTKLFTSMQPTFPMQNMPSCPNCGCKPLSRKTTSLANSNGNAGRPYYICIGCKTDPAYNMCKTGYRNGWISWDDDRGVDPSNHDCDCGVACRQDRAGNDSLCPGRGFWTCATASCGYLSFRMDGLTDDAAKAVGAAPDAGFELWLF